MIDRSIDRHGRDANETDRSNGRRDENRCDIKQKRAFVSRFAKGRLRP